MNVQALKQMSVTPMLCVPTLKDPTSAAVLVDIRVMDETAQVNISCICFFGVVWYFSNSLILISIDFYNFIFPFTPYFLFRLRRYIKYSRVCFIRFPNTIVFSTLFSVFGNRMKHYLSRVWYYFKTQFFHSYPLAVIPGCSPSCGPNASCQERGGLPACVCNSGFQGDGYNCTGWSNLNN